MKRIATVLVLVASLPLSNPVLAQPDASVAARADELLRVGLERYDAGDFDGAVAAFEEGYAVDPRPTFLFAAAQARRRSGDCASAIDYYDRFLATSPPESQAAAARDQRARCVESLPAPEPVPPPPPPVVAAPAPAPEPRRWYTDPLTDALVGTAGALVITGVGFSLSSSSAVADANAADNYDQYGDAADRASRYRTIGLVSLASGVAVGAFATWRIIRHDGRRDSSDERPGVARALRVGPGPGIGVSLAGGF